MSDTDTTPKPVEYVVAKQNLQVDGINAFTQGDMVPKHVADERGWGDLVEKAVTAKGEPTKAAEKLQAEAAADPFPGQPQA